jgi:mycothione reductase
MQGKVALIEAGPFGGTCINRGCIPSKMFAYTADLAAAFRDASRFGLCATLENVEWSFIRDRVIAQVEKTSREGRQGRVDSEDVTLFEAHARFVGPHELAIGGQDRIEAEEIVIATGSRPTIPAVVSSANVPFHTSDTVMRLESLPASMTIVGGGPVAVEMAHIFSSFGVEVQVLEMASSLLDSFDDEIARRFTEICSERWDVRLGVEIAEIRTKGSGVVVVLDSGVEIYGDLLFVATGRQPNTDDLGLESAGVLRHDDGRVVVDEFGRAAPGIWALGDCSSPFELKHVANAEARTVAHNVMHPDDLRPLPHDWVPQAVFSRPQVASVGARSQDLAGRAYVEATQRYGDVAYGWAIEDNDGFCKLYADPSTGTLLGAHVLGPDAPLLIAPLIQAMAHGQRVRDLARGQYWIHPTLAEVVENALLQLPLEGRASGQAH